MRKRVLTIAKALAKLAGAERDVPAHDGRVRNPSGHVRIRDFSRGRFIRGTEMEDIYLTLRVGLEGTPMASYDALADSDLWARAAYVRSLIRERPVYDFLCRHRPDPAQALQHSPT
jgi:hypothetical protein